MKTRNCLLLILFIFGAQFLSSAPSVRIKEIAYLKGIRENQLMGIGLVTGLSGKGDSSTSMLLRNALARLVSNFGFKIEPKEIKSKNCAVVMVSCEVPPFLRAGDLIDVRVSSIGDAGSVEGGVLLQTPLKGANGRIYALAQGQIFSMSPENKSKTVGNITKGAIVEQDIISRFITDGAISIILRNPDFVTASTVASAVQKAFSDISVQTIDASMIEVKIPSDRAEDPMGFIAELESLAITPNTSGKIVIDAASGIIIFGEEVRIGKVAVSYKSIKVSVSPLITPLMEEEQPKEHFTIEETTTVEELVNTLQTIGLKTETIINILKAIDRTGSLYGELIIM